MLGSRSLRFRIAFAYILGTLAVAGFVAVATYGITSRVLTRQAIRGAEEKSFGEVGFLKEGLTAGTRPFEELVSDLQQRGLCVVLIHPANPASTCVAAGERTVPQSLRKMVEGGQGRVGYVVTTVARQRGIVFGSFVPQTRPQIYMYFFYSLEDVDRTLSLLWRVLLGVVAAAMAIAGAVGLRLADRTIKPLRAAADAARKVAEGELHTRLQETGTDELGRLARAFNSMTAALEQRIERERRFVADASHELRTPLTALKTSIDFAAQRAEDLPPRVRAAVGLAAEEVQSLRRLVDDLLELSRAEAGGIHVELEDVDLVDFAAQLARRRAPGTHVDIDGPGSLVVRTDKSRLERVVGNLLENAVVHGGGQDIRISLDASNGEAHITVTDQGPGIAPDQLSQIFDRFWRGDASRKRDGRVGAGLGLAIARENAALIGADLHVESGTEGGTRFEVVLPNRDES